MAAKIFSPLDFKNLQFTRLLKAEGTLREFNFRKSINQENIIFHVDVTDDRGNRILFNMQKQDDLWKIQPSELPSWITKSENELHNLIEQEL